MRKNDPQYFESLYPINTREAEITSLLNILASGKSAQLIGIPGSGKGSLLRIITYNKEIRLKHLGENQEKVHFVLMDFSEMKKRSLFDVLKFILVSLSYSLSERGFTKLEHEVNQKLKDALTLNDELILFQALKSSIDYLCLENDMQVYFLFDRFSEYINDIDERFFLNLKILRQRAKFKFGAVFALNRPLEESIEPMLISEFYEYIAGSFLHLPFADPIGMTFRMGYLEKVTKKSLSPQVKKDLLTLTGGHVKLVRIGTELLLSGEYKNVDKYLLSQNAILAALFEIWSSLTSSEQLSLIEKSENEYLTSVGILNKLSITIPLFEEFIKTIPKTTEKFRYDAGRNLIFKVDADITEKLSSSEFRLLAFLLSNEDRIVLKDEIITAVWKDTETQQGVTDQALDQIIYRIRKKIEDNPNAPVHLITIKGRGYKMTNNEA